MNMTSKYSSEVFFSFCIISSKFPCMLLSLSKPPLKLDTCMQVNTNVTSILPALSVPSGSCAKSHSQEPWTSPSYSLSILNHFFHALSSLQGSCSSSLWCPGCQRQIANICHFYIEHSASDNRFLFFSQFWDVITICFFSLGFPRKLMFPGKPVVFNYVGRLPLYMSLLWKACAGAGMGRREDPELVRADQQQDSRFQFCAVMCMLSGILP